MCKKFLFALPLKGSRKHALLLTKYLVKSKDHHLLAALKRYTHLVTLISGHTAEVWRTKKCPASTKQETEKSINVETFPVVLPSVRSVGHLQAKGRRQGVASPWWNALLNRIPCKKENLSLVPCGEMGPSEVFWK